MSFIASLFSKPKKPKVFTPPKMSDAEIQAKVAEEQRRAALAQGRASTILTGQTRLGDVGRA